MNHITKTPEHVAIYRRVRDLILFGEMAPGQPATIQGLVDEVGAGMTPVREAIRRLTAEGALQALGNRRISVPELTVSSLNQVDYARQAIEPHLAERAANNGAPGLADELADIDEKLNLAIKRGDIRGYLENNFRFHFHLYQASEAQVLCDIAMGLWLRVGPSLRVVCGRVGAINMPDQHVEMVTAIRERDPAAVRAALAADITQGMSHIRAAISEE